MLPLKLKIVTTNCRGKQKATSEKGIQHREKWAGEWWRAPEKGGARPPTPAPQGRPAPGTGRAGAGLRGNEQPNPPRTGAPQPHAAAEVSSYWPQIMETGLRVPVSVCVRIFLQTRKSKSIFSPQNPLIKSMLPQRAAGRRRWGLPHSPWGLSLVGPTLASEGRKDGPPKWHLPLSQVPPEASHELWKYIFVPFGNLQDTFIYRVPTIEIWQPLFKWWQDIKAPLFFNV